MAARNLISWNAILLANQHNRSNAEACLVYLRMNLEGVQPNAVTFVAVVGALSEMEPGLNTVSRGRAVHARAAASGFASHTVLQNALISMYSRCRCLEEARRVFDEIQDRSRVSGTSIISAYAQDDKWVEMFLAMNLDGVQPDEMTLSALCAACSQLADPGQGLAVGRGVHARIRAAGHDRNPVVGTALVCMYARCSCLVEAAAVFDKLTPRDVVSWNAMLAATVEAGEAVEALRLHQHMRAEGVMPDAAKFAVVAAACSALKDEATSRAVHSEVAARGLDGHPVSGTALVCMYAKCGCLDDGADASISSLKLF